MKSIQQGIPGEVSMTNLNDAINGTSAYSNAVPPLTSHSPTVEEQTLKLNELITAPRR